MLRDWRVELISFVPNVLQTSSVLHVAVLVYLRLLAVLKPLEYTNMDAKIRKASIPVIWILSIGTRLLAVLTQCLKAFSFYSYYRYIVLHGFHTIPIICIACMYFKLLLTIRSKFSSPNDGEFSNSKSQDNTISSSANNSNMQKKELKKKSTALVKWVVFFLLICYVPLLVWEQYWAIIITSRIPFRNESFFEVLNDQNTIS